MLTIEPLHAEFGARITGADMKTGHGPELGIQIWDLIDQYSLLCFPDQGLQDEHQLSFTKMLGEPEPNHVVLGQEGRIEYFGTIGNVVDGKQLGNDHKRTVFQTGNNMWHSDSSFRDIPSKLSLMSAYEVPDVGGVTEFVSCRAAYQRLSTDAQMQMDPLVAIHDYVFSRSKVHPDAVSPSHAASLPPVKQKLVRENPGNKQKNIYIGSHAREIEGWGFDKSRDLLDDLIEEATGQDHIYGHQWKVGDFVIWDNRCLLHRGAGYDADKYRRRMQQTRVAGVYNTLEE